MSPENDVSLLGQGRSAPSMTVAVGSTVRNRHTGDEVKVEAVDREAHRYRLAIDAKGPAKDVGWSAEGLDEHWLHVS